MPRVLGTFGAAALILAASTILGLGIRRLAGWGGSALTAPAFGLAGLVALTALVIRLPGRGTTASVLIVALLVLCVWFLVRERPRVSAEDVAAPLLIVACCVLAASIPFLASRRVGLLGISINDDMSTHLVWAQALKSGAFARQYPLPPSYPLGPHSLAATVSSLAGIRLDLVFQGLLIATLAVTGLVAGAAMSGQRLWRMLPVAVVGAAAYLVSAYYSEAAFKETMMALFLLAAIVAVRELRVGGGVAVRRVRRWSEWARGGIPFGVLVAGAVQAYTYVGLAWLGGFAVICVALEALFQGDRLLDRSWHRRLIGPTILVAASGAVAILLLVPAAGRVINYFQGAGFNPAAGGAIAVNSLGNLAGPLSTFEGLGLWRQADFRFPTADAFQTGEWAAFALVVLVYGLWHAVRRRDLVWPAGVAICAAVYFYSQDTQSPYVAAKALEIAAPVVAVCGARALFVRGHDAGLGALARPVVGVLYVGLALYSSLLVLRAGPVFNEGRVDQLERISSIVGHDRVLFLAGNDLFVPWEMRGTALSALGGQVTPAVPTDKNGAKFWQPGTPMDFDSFTAPELNAVRYYVTSDGAYASQVPAGIVLLRHLGNFNVYKRVGMVAPRQTIEPLTAPGAVLDCTQPVARRVSRQRGVASVWAVPPVVVQEPTVFAGFAVLTPGAHHEVTMNLAPGDWDLSLNYQSGEPLVLSAGGRRLAGLPPMLGEQGQYYAAGRVHSTGGPVIISIEESHPSRLTSPNAVLHLDGLAATMSPEMHQVVPLAKACGRYVDWFMTGGAAPAGG